MHYIVIALCCLAIAAAFIYTEHKEKYVPAVLLKGLASLCFVLFGILGSELCANASLARKIVIGLILGCAADVLLNLRFVFKKNGQISFLIGILVFLSGHVMYLVALIPFSGCFVLSLIVGIVLTALTLVWIFSKINAKKAFKIFGIFYIGAIMIMTCVSVGILITSPSAFSAIFTVGAVLFLVSDVVLILNTFGSETKFSLRITNLSLYYIGQLMIGLSLQLMR